MENSYGIGVKNRYALFYNEDEDPLEILKAQEAEREKKKELKLQEKENKSKGTVHTVVTKAKQQPTTNLTKKNVKDIPPVKTQELVTPKKDENNKSRSQKPPLDRNVKFNTSPREAPLDLEERKNRRNRDERGPPPSEFRERDRGEGEIRRGGRGGGRGGRGRGRGRGIFDNRGKREFDRQSGSDKSVKPIDKREGAGSHNWGTIQDEMDEQLNNTAMSEETQEWTERPEEVPEQNEAPKVEEQVNAEPEEIKPSEEQPRQMTLDEWKKECEKNRAVPHYNLRKAGEGEDVSQWKKTYILKKKEKEEEEEEESEEDDEEEVVRRGRQKQLVEIEINFSDSRRGRGRGRGGRGGGSGGGSSGGGGGGGSGGSSGGGMGGGPGLGSGTRGRMPRPERGLRTNNKTKSQSAPKVDDENDFPSLQTA